MCQGQHLVAPHYTPHTSKYDLHLQRVLITSLLMLQKFALKQYPLEVAVTIY